MIRTRRVTIVVAMFGVTLLPMLAFGQGPPTPQVEVANFPDPQNVTGAVEVSNDGTMPVPVTAEIEYRYTGLSTAFVTSYVGLNGMHEACRATFGPAARMCTTEELFRTPDLAEKPVREPGGSWVHPVIVAVAFDDAGRDLRVVDFTGVMLGTGIPNGGRGSCNGWQSPDPNGSGAIYAAPAGKRTVSHDRCIGGFENTKPVTCCVPRGQD